MKHPSVVVLTPEELGELVERTTAQAVIRALEGARLEMQKVLDEVRAARGVLTQDQACEFFNVNEDTLRRYRKMGLKYYRVGQQPFYSMDDIEVFIRMHPETLLNDRSVTT